MAMDKRTKIAITIVAALGLISVVSSFAGEAMRSKVSPVMDPDIDECQMIIMPDFALGVAAGLTLILAILILRVETGHPFWSCGPPRPPSKIWIVIFSWNFSAVGTLLLFLVVQTTYSCKLVPLGVFSASGFLALGGIACGVVYYVWVIGMTSEKECSVELGRLRGHQGTDNEAETAAILEEVVV